MTTAIVLFIVAAVFVVQSIKVVPHQHAWVVERWASTTRRSPRA
jgi:regulator of protease activity HflC (stomatin/prohibitin superfamily)